MRCLEVQSLRKVAHSEVELEVAAHSRYLERRSSMASSGSVTQVART